MEPDALRVVVVVDDAGERKAIKSAFDEGGYEVRARANGRGFGRMVDEFRPDAAILDVRLENGPNGLALTAQLRELGDTGIVLLAGTDATDECLAAFAAGGDDYLKRPFHIEELLARTGALMRRLGRSVDRVRRFGDIVIDEVSETVRRRAVVVPVTPTEYDVLLLLAGNSPTVLSKYQILAHIRGGDAWDENVVEVHVSALRRKLEATGPRVIHTVRGAGYAFRPAPESSSDVLPAVRVPTGVRKASEYLLGTGCTRVSVPSLFRLSH